MNKQWLINNTCLIKINSIFENTLEFLVEKFIRLRQSRTNLSKLLLLVKYNNKTFAYSYFNQFFLFSIYSKKTLIVEVIKNNFKKNDKNVYK